MLENAAIPTLGDIDYDDDVDPGSGGSSAGTTRVVEYEWLESALVLARTSGLSRLKAQERSYMQWSVFQMVKERNSGQNASSSRKGQGEGGAAEIAECEAPVTAIVWAFVLGDQLNSSNQPETKYVGDCVATVLRDHLQFVCSPDRADEVVGAGAGVWFDLGRCIGLFQSESAEFEGNSGPGSKLGRQQQIGSSELTMGNMSADSFVRFFANSSLAVQFALVQLAAFRSVIPFSYYHYITFDARGPQAE